MPSPRRRRRSKEKPVECAICGEFFKVLTVSHLRTHGYTKARYARVYGGYASDLPAPPAQTRPKRPASSTFGDPAALAPVLAEKLLAEPEFLHSLADEVGDLIFTGPLRQRLRVGLVSVLVSRLEAHGTATAQLQRVRDALKDRIDIDPSGENTKTADLVSMGHQALAEVKTAEDVLLRTVKAAIDESKGNTRHEEGIAPLDRFTGEAESIPVPADLTAGERETVRALMGNLKRLVERQRVINVEAAATPSPSPSESERTNQDIEGVIRAEASQSNDEHSTSDTHAHGLHTEPTDPSGDGQPF